MENLKLDSTVVRGYTCAAGAFYDTVDKSNKPWIGGLESPRQRNHMENNTKSTQSS